MVERLMLLFPLGPDASNEATGTRSLFTDLRRRWSLCIGWIAGSPRKRPCCR